MPRSAWAVEPREETGDGTESSAMLDRGSGPPGSRRYVIEGNTCLLRLYIARLIYHACFRSSALGRCASFWRFSFTASSLPSGLTGYYSLATRHSLFAIRHCLQIHWLLTTGHCSPATRHYDPLSPAGN